MYIHQTDNWPRFTWDAGFIEAKLAKVNKASCSIPGRSGANPNP
ncbi:MAG: DUF4172 domain-containing protein [Bacteroidales bacterium]|nr:DUF4172 domain-containing protein [Bacteroidales bacterium]